MMRAMVSMGLERALTALQPFLRVVRELGPLSNDPEACDFLAGNPEEPALPGYVETLQKWTVPVHRKWFAYGFGHPRARVAAAAALGEELGLAFEPDDILLTRGAHGALALALRMVVDAGDEVVFITPPWFFYEAMILGAGATPVRVPVHTATFDLDVAAIADALTPRTRVVLINTPNNPTGRIYPSATLERLADTLRRHAGSRDRPVYVLSDESYSKVLFDGNRMVSPASFYAHTLLVHTYSKSALAPGQRLGYLALPAAMPGRERLRQMAMVAALATANALPDAVMQYALADIEHIALDLPRLQRRRDRMLGALRAMGYEVHTPEATFYLMPRSPSPDDWAFARALAREKVLVLPGEVVEMPGYFRISLTGTDDMVERSLPVLDRAIRASGTPGGRS
jgi:aspartate aminotransferase